MPGPRRSRGRWRSLRMRGGVGDTECMRAYALALASLTALTAQGCTTYHDQLVRGDHAFEANDHDRTIAILRDIEPDFQRLSPADQADYAYVRGMADYNVGYKADARHWLAVARGVEEATPGALAPERKAKVATTLNELNAVVYSEGNTTNLVNGRTEPAPKADAEAPARANAKKKPAPKPAEEPVDDTAPDAPAEKPPEKPDTKKPVAPKKE